MTTKALRKQLVAAIAMVLVAAVALGSSTYAWFAMNTVVDATNMQVRAVAEKGLLINEVATANDTHWDEEATAAQTASDPVLLYPASTADGTAWYHAASKKSNDEAGATSGNASTNLIGTYENLNSPNALVEITSMTAAAVEGTNAARSTMGRAATSPAGYYVKYTYYLKGASGSQLTLGQNAGDMNVYIKDVVATLPGSAASADLDKSVRVGIKLNSAFYIFAPVTGFTSSYFVNADTTATEPTAGGQDVNVKTDLASLPAAGSPGTPVDVYVWYEGEDENCMSNNALASTLDNIEIDLKFELKEVPAAVGP